MKLKTLNITILIIILISHFGFAQDNIGTYEINKQIYYGSMKVDINQFHENLLKVIVFEKLNRQRNKRGLEVFAKKEILDSIARNQAVYMSQTGGVSVKQKGKLNTTEKRAVFYGASKNVIENVFKFSLSRRAGEDLNYENLANDIIFKLYNSLKLEKLLDNQEYIFAGFGIVPERSGNKIFLSLILGNYSSLNNGADIGTNNLPISTKKYGLKDFNAKACRKCKSYKAIENMQNALHISDGKIYFEYDDFKRFKRLIRGKFDGLAVDIVMKDQYQCFQNNIVDNNLLNKGYLTKRIYANKLYKNNLITDRKENKIFVELAQFPEEIVGNYELNLVIIKNKHVCENIRQSFIIEEDAYFSNPISLVADSITMYSQDVFKPKIDTAFLSFKIPFEKRKSDYKKEDIEPFLKLLNEPEFIINELNIYAYSSIEGTNKENIKLQNKRAKSIVTALKKRQKDSIITEIYTDFNWQDFKNDISGTKYNKLADLSMDEAQEYIRKKSLHEKLEPILKNHRYAKIDMKVIYDISGEKEEKYVLSRFNKAIQNKNMPLALSIQKYIFKKIVLGQYSEQAIYLQKIPFEKNFAGLLMNQLWLRKYIEKQEVEMYAFEINELYKLDSENKYILFNYLFTNVLFNNVVDSRNVGLVQNSIESLYFSTFTKRTIDALNMEFQLKIIDSIKVFDKPDKMHEESLDRIKKIYEIKESSEQNSLKLAYLFINNGDYEFATKLIEPYASNDVVSEKLIFTYLALCSHSEYRTSTKKFEKAMQIAAKLNNERFCDLFNGESFSFQIFENPYVKNFVCNTCFAN